MSDKPSDCRCDFCWKNGDCDTVAQRMGWCGLVKLYEAVAAVEPEEVSGG